MTCFSTARSVTTSSAAIAALERPSAISPSTSRSRGVSSSSGSSRALAAEHLRDDLGVERRAAAADAAHRVGERVDVGDPVLEQVAEPLGALGEQLARVGDLDVLGEHEDADLGQLGADLARRPQALVGVGRRHPHVDDGDVGLVGADLAQQLLGVAGLADDLEPGLLEQAHHALAQQGRVVGDDYPHGILARTVVPSPAGLSTSSSPVERRDPVGEPAQAGAGVGVGAADAVVADLDLDHAVRRAPTRTRRAVGLGVAGDVGQRLGDDEVGRPTRPAPAAARSGSRRSRPAPASDRRAAAAPPRGRGR